MAKMNLLIDESASVRVEIWVGDDNGTILAWDTEKASKESQFGKDHPDDILYIEAFFREPNYKDVSELSDRAFEANQDGTVSMNLNAVRLERVCKLIKSWNLKDANGKDIPANRKNIENLNPSLAFFLTTVLEQKLGINVPVNE